jgi:G3E family GTPase
MKITLVTGLLGAGKTSFIKNCIDSADDSTVVLVNDFGSIGIDGDVINSGGLETVELPSGCVCCTLKSDLQSALKNIAQEMKPKHLVIEPSGLSSPAGVLEALDVVQYTRVDVVSVIDASEFLDLHKEEIYGDFFLAQVRLADIVLVNKVDLTDAVTIEGTVKLVGELNPDALIIKTVEAKVRGELPVVQGRQKDVLSKGHELAFGVMALEINTIVDAQRVRDLFTEIAAGRFGEIVRAKALIITTSGSIKFDLAWGKYNEVAYEPTLKQSRLVVIGPTIEEEELKQYLFKGKYINLLPG